MPRLFFAIPIPQRIRREIEKKVLPALHAHARDLSISHPSKWHITTHFIGDVSPAAERKIKEAFARVQLPPTQPLKLGGEKTMDVLSGHVVYVPVHDEAGLLTQLNELHRLHAPTGTHYAYGLVESLSFFD